MRLITLCLGTGLLFTLTACPPPDEGEDAGNGGGTDAGTEDDAATGNDASTELLANGAVCHADNECESNICLITFGIGNAYCSLSCAADPDCDAMGDGASYNCLQMQTGSRCVRVCDGAGNCPAENECLPNIQWGTDLLDVCLDMRGQYCDSQADCAEGVCSYLNTGAAWINFCDASDNHGQIAVGDACDYEGYGDPCNNSTDCPTGLTCHATYKYCELPPERLCGGLWCLQHEVCSGPCAQDADCPTGMRCRTFDFEIDYFTDDPTDDEIVPVRACWPFTGSGSTCATDADCSGTERCVIYNDAAGVYGSVCREPDSGAVDFGGACGDDPVTEQTQEPDLLCASELCIWGECSQLCEADADCGDPALYQCRTAGSASEPFSFCLQGALCDTDADCTVAGEVCHPLVALDGFEGQCLTANGDLRFGEACEHLDALAQDRTCVDDSDCTSVHASLYCGFDHMCRPPRASMCSIACLSNHVCTQVCAADADCGDTATWVCSGISFANDTKNTGDPTDDTMAVGTICTWFPGSRATCARDADCTAPEVCRPHIALNGTITTKCGEPTPNNAAPGEACGIVASDAVYCANDLCDYNDGDGDTSTGICGAVCVDDNDCPTGLTCQTLPVVPNESVTLDVCRMPGAGGRSG